MKTNLTPDNTPIKTVDRIAQARRELQSMQRVYQTMMTFLPINNKKNISDVQKLLQDEFKSSLGSKKEEINLLEKQLINERRKPPTFLIQLLNKIKEFFLKIFYKIFIQFPFKNTL